MTEREDPRAGSVLGPQPATQRHPGALEDGGSMRRKGTKGNIKKCQELSRVVTPPGFSQELPQESKEQNRGLTAQLSLFGGLDG